MTATVYDIFWILEYSSIKDERLSESRLRKWLNTLFSSTKIQAYIYPLLCIVINSPAFTWLVSLYYVCCVVYCNSAGQIIYDLPSPRLTLFSLPHLHSLKADHLDDHRV